MNAQEVATVPLFQEAPRARCIQVAQLAHRLGVPAGKGLAREGELASEFFVIMDGTASVLRDGEVVRQLHPGDFFGEIALVGKPYRTATVVANSEMEIVVMPRHEFRTMLARFPRIAATVLTSASRRIVSDLQEPTAQKT